MMHILDPIISPGIFMACAYRYLRVAYLARRLSRITDWTDKRIVTWSWQLRVESELLRKAWRRLLRGH